jgi:sulfate transport system ATP-binding protein
MTVRENMGYGLKVRRAPKGEARRRVEEVAAMLGLRDLLERKPAQLSGGQRQRVALARALSVDPKVLLLDEPFGALDANVRRDLRRWLREIHGALGITTIFVTHDQEEALDLADRVVILNQGEIVQQGTPKEVCRQPNSAFVMRFLGDANRVSGVARGGKVYVGENELPFSYAQGDGAVEIYARPSDLEWEDLHEGIPASVARVLDRAGERRVIASTDGGDLLEFDVPPENDVAAGDRGSVIISRAKIFPAA